MDWTIEKVLEGWIADRKISRRKLAFLKQMHNLNVNSGGESLICPSHISSELDLPNGSSWPFVIADFLDYQEALKLGHTVTKHKIELGEKTFSKVSGEEDEPDAVVLTVDSLIDDYIS